MHERKHFSILPLICMLIFIAVGVSAVVYGIATHRRHVYKEKWKDYDECGMT